MYNDFMYSKIDHLNFFLLDAETAKAAFKIYDFKNHL